MKKEYSDIFFDKKFEKFCVYSGQSVLEAMAVVENGRERACIVVDNDRRLKKVVTDGDVRRYLLNGGELDGQIEYVHDRNPIVAKLSEVQSGQYSFENNVDFVPVIDDSGALAGLILRREESTFPSNSKKKSVAVVGLGYVGLTLALVLADNGYLVLGLDRDDALIQSLKKGVEPFHEDGLTDLLQSHIGNSLKVSSDPAEIWADIYILTVGTPVSRDSKKPNVDHIKNATLAIAENLKAKDLVILRSTVPVGCTREVVIPLLEKSSGLICGKDFFVAYCPERTAEGKALKELRDLPQIIGAFDDRSRELAMSFFYENTHTVVDVGSLEAAELCKLIDNTYRDTIFGYSNQMSLITESLGLDLNFLINKVNLGYERNQIPKPSPGVGGPCLSKDPYILMETFSRYGLDCGVTRSSREINEFIPKNIYRRTERILSMMGKDITNEKVFIVGFAFKGEPVTSDLRDSTTLRFVEFLSVNGVADLWGYDPVVNHEELSTLGVKPCSIEQGFNAASVVFFMNNHRSYLDLNIRSLVKKMNLPAVLYDGWALFPAHEFKKLPGINYIGTGIG